MITLNFHLLDESQNFFPSKEDRFQIIKSILDLIENTHPGLNILAGETEDPYEHITREWLLDKGFSESFTKTAKYYTKDGMLIDSDGVYIFDVGELVLTTRKDVSDLYRIITGKNL